MIKSQSGTGIFKLSNHLSIAVFLAMFFAAPAVAGGWGLPVTLKVVEDTQHSLVLIVMPMPDVSSANMDFLSTDFDASLCDELSFTIVGEPTFPWSVIGWPVSIADHMMPYRADLHQLAATTASVNLSFIAEAGYLMQLSDCSFETNLSDFTFQFFDIENPDLVLGL